MLRSGLELMERAATHKTQYVGLGQRVEVIDDVDAKYAHRFVDLFLFL